MNIRRIIPISMLMLAACGPANNRTARIAPHQPVEASIVLIDPPVAAVTVSEVTVPIPEYSAARFDSLAGAVNSVLTDNIKVIAFAEIHKSNNSTLTSTLQNFAPEVVPLLASKGIRDLVLESLPSNPRAEAEANRGRFGPFLREWFAYHSDYCGVLETLEQAHSNGVKLHGVHFHDLAEQYAHFNELRVLINQRTLAATNSLLEKGQRVALYNGLDHNSVDCLAGTESFCFGKALHTTLGNDYLEVDLLLPELAAGVDPRNIDFADWEAQIPDQGVNLIRMASGRNLLILPRTEAPVQAVFPEQFPTCHVNAM